MSRLSKGRRFRNSMIHSENTDTVDICMTIKMLKSTLSMIHKRRITYVGAPLLYVGAPPMVPFCQAVQGVASTELAITAETDDCR